MALHLNSLRAPLRTKHAWNIFATSHEVLQSCIYSEQRRGKKKVTKTSSLKVKLLEDIPKYGRRGAIVPVATGRMRNDWYPRRKADYMTDAQLRNSSLRDVPAERDFNFRPDLRGMQQVEEEADNSTVIDLQSQLLAPQRATELIATLLPPVLDFYRAPISSPSAEKPQPETLTRPMSRAVNSAAADLAAASEPVPKPQPAAIYGSVSTQDIASAVKAVLALDSEGARVVLGAEDVSFVQNAEAEGGADTDRVPRTLNKEFSTFFKRTLEIIRPGQKRNLSLRVSIDIFRPEADCTFSAGERPPPQRFRLELLIVAIADQRLSA
ncbi:hypothetical protein MMC16_007856 [Acarospora aff. strigata]|nr:hypothetical protein [Acarospora aff. strigata]